MSTVGRSLIVSTDYSTFGVDLNARSFSSSSYRYGFQGQEKDNEIKPGTGSSDGNSVNFTYRMYDSRLGRFLSIDPLTSKYAYYSPYSFSGNRVIDRIELEGLEPAIPIEWLGPVEPILTIPRMPIPPTIPVPPIIPTIPVAPTVPISPAAPTIPQAPSIPIIPDAPRVPVDWITEDGIDWDNPPATPEDLPAEWKEVSHPDAAANGHREFEHSESGNRIKFDKGKPGESGYEGKDHWHRVNPNYNKSNGKKGENMYLDRQGNPVNRGSDKSHIVPATLPVIDVWPGSDTQWKHYEIETDKYTDKLIKYIIDVFEYRLKMIDYKQKLEEYKEQKKDYDKKRSDYYENCDCIT